MEKCPTGKKQDLFISNSLTAACSLELPGNRKSRLFSFIVAKISPSKNHKE